jgi:hypothetical protein
MPPLRSKIQVVGFPVGGDMISVTEGVVSRVEVTEYSHSSRAALAMIVDAAINAGNSGGPVISEGKLVGVAFQKHTGFIDDIEGQGHAVPACLIHRFLRGVEKGKDLTLPSLRVSTQDLESGSLRKRFGLSDAEGGVLVTGISAGPGEEVALQRFDVIKKIDGYNIDAFGSVSYLGHRVQMHPVVHDKFYVGDSVDILVKRAGKDLKLKQKLLPTSFLVPRGLYDQQTSFFITGGLVFQQLTQEFLEERGFLPHLSLLYHGGILTENRTEVVVLGQILSHEVNLGFSADGVPIVAAINNQPVFDLASAYEMTQQAVRASEFLEIALECFYGSSTIVLDSSSVQAADAEIQQMYRLPKMASDNFSPFWQDIEPWSSIEGDEEDSDEEDSTQDATD